MSRPTSAPQDRLDNDPRSVEMDMFNQQLVQAEITYRIERGRGRSSAWARTEGRQDPVVTRWRRRRTTPTAGGRTAR
jgi:hypothetical protein